MNIGVAKPSVCELEEIRHYFINSHSIHDTVNAAAFRNYATDAAKEIFSKNNVAVMVGGTGLYIKAFTKGLDDIPEIPEQVRLHIIRQYEEKGIVWLQEELKEKDPLYYAAGEIMNPQRSMRALEVMLATGRSIKELHNTSLQKDNYFEINKYALDVFRQQLYQNINQRVDKMMEDGLAEEVRSLLPFHRLNALQTVGYKELFEHFNGNISLTAAVDKIKQNTRHYAKRQLTWFRKDPEIKWIRGIEDIVNGRIVNSE